MNVLPRKSCVNSQATAWLFRCYPLLWNISYLTTCYDSFVVVRCNGKFISNPLLSNWRVLQLHHSGFQPSCHTILYVNISYSEIPPRLFFPLLFPSPLVLYNLVSSRRGQQKTNWSSELKRHITSTTWGKSEIIPIKQPRSNITFSILHIRVIWFDSQVLRIQVFCDIPRFVS